MERLLYTDNEELLRLIASGDEKAFNQLFERYRNRLYSYLIKITKSPESAEEATLDVFLKIWNARAILREIGNFEAFLFRVAHNQAVDHLRRAAKSKLIQQELWIGLETLAASETADQRILSSDMETQIASAMNRLSPQRREAFRLSREEYLNYDEIAERMQLSRNTIRNHLSAALQFIRDNLDKGPEMATLIILSSRLY
jgi:RNA polymerase sigma-70 factor (family 1)